MGANLDREHNRLIQVEIDGDPCRIPHAPGVAATARAVDSWKRPVHPTEAHLVGLERCRGAEGKPSAAMSLPHHVVNLECLRLDRDIGLLERLS